MMLQFDNIDVKYTAQETRYLEDMKCILDLLNSKPTALPPAYATTIRSSGISAILSAHRKAFWGTSLPSAAALALALGTHRTTPALSSSLVAFRSISLPLAPALASELGPSSHLLASKIVFRSAAPLIVTKLSASSFISLAALVAATLFSLPLPTVI